MANVKISELPAASAAVAANEFEINEAGTSKKVTGTQVAAFVEGVVSSSPSFTGVVSLADGSAGAPSLTNTGDTNTGLLFPSADTVGVSSGGTQRLTVNTAGVTVNGTLNLPNANSFLTGAGHNVFQVDANTTYLYGGGLGVSLRSADNSAELINITNTGILSTITPGTSNFRMGVAAGLGIQSGGNLNVVVGDQAGNDITTGDENSYFGYAAGDDSSTGVQNTAIGSQALSAGSSLGNNTMVGRAAGESINNGENTSVGANSMFTATQVAGAVAVGSHSMFSHNVGTGALTNNTAVGYYSGYSVTDGLANTLIGSRAGYGSGTSTRLTTGDSNTLIGYFARTNAAGTNQANCLGANLGGDSGFTTIGYSSSDIRAAHGNVTWSTVSDVRYKKDIVSSTAGLSFINDLTPRTFKYKELGELPETFNAYEADSTKVFKNSYTNHGFIAQEVKTAIDNHPELKDGFKLWDSRSDGSQEIGEAALIPILVKAIQEQNALIVALTARVATLEG